MRISYSKRGLTFSFKQTETFKAGGHYRYFIDTKNNEIILISDENGKYRFSKKGPDGKPLVDLRNAEIKEAMSLSDYMEIEILEDKIIVHVIKKKINTEGLNDYELVDLLDKEEKVSFEIPKEELIEHDSVLIDMLTASGFFSQKQEDLRYVFDVISLFSGAGLLDYPFKKDESFDIKFAIDFDKTACETYKNNIGDHILCMDIRDLDESRVPDTDVVIGGPCCQGYSNANRAGNTQQDITKRLLIDDYIRIVKAKNPLMFVIENVPQFVTKDDGIYLQKILTELSEYEISYCIVNDNEVGGYTIRNRMVLIGSRIGKVNIPNVELSQKRTAGDALKRVTTDWVHYNDVTKPKKETEEKMAFVRPGHNYKDIPSMAHLVRHSDTYKRLSLDEPAVTIVNWRKINLMPPVGNRILSVAEAAALMGLEKDFIFSGSLGNKQQQVGNGVTQAIATFIKSIVKNALYKYTNTQLGLSY